MKRNVNVLTICLLLLVSLFFQDCGKKNEKIVVISGSRTMGPMLAALAESYQKNHNESIAIQSPGSLKGFTMLLEGKCELVASSVKMPAQQVLDAQKKSIVLKEFIIGYDIITPIVHSSNPLKNLFLGQLGDMYTGLIKDWKSIEGRPGTVIVVDRDDDSGTRLLMNERFFEATTIVEGSIKKKTDAEVVSYIAKHPGAVGYISKRYCDKSVRPININGFSATLENIEKGYYPLYRELYLYVNEKSYTGVIKSFIDFSMNKSGQDLIEKTGFIPVSRMSKPLK
jgi:phosphate transport system substrate-binding protein